MTERYLIKLYIVKMSTDSTCESATVINSFDLDFMFWESSNAGSFLPQCQVMNSEIHFYFESDTFLLKGWKQTKRQIDILFSQCYTD